MIALVFAIISSAAMSLVLKMFSSEKGNRYGILLGNYFTCIIIAFLSLPDKGMVFPGEKFTVCFGIFAGCLYVLGLYMLQTCAAANGAILTATFSKLGLLVPLAISIILFGERPGVLQYIGIVLVIFSFFIIQPENKGGKNVRSLILILTLLAAGISDSTSKIFEHYGSRSDDRLFFFYIFFTAFLVCAMLLFREKKLTGKKVLVPDLIAGLVLGIPNYYSSYLVLTALVTIPGYLVYTIFSVGTILLVTTVSIPVFREKLSLRQTAGMAVILTALVLLNI